MISAIPIVPQTVGANRVIRGMRIEHVCGDPSLSEAGDHELNLRITRTALRALVTKVDGPTIFDPFEVDSGELVNVS